ncbi:unnamed protein product, partial [Oikopleura dioica]
RKDDGVLSDEEWWNKYGKKTVTIISHEINRRKFNDNNMPENSRIAGGWIEGNPTVGTFIKEQIPLWHNFGWRQLHPSKELYLKYVNKKGKVLYDLQITHYNRQKLIKELRQHGFFQADRPNQTLTDIEKAAPYVKYIYKRPGPKTEL